MHSVATRHVPICVSGISDVLIYQRHYPGKVEVWVKFKHEETAIEYNSPRVFMFDTYPISDFNLPQVKHELLKIFSTKDDPKEPESETNFDKASLRESLNQLKRKRTFQDEPDSLDGSKLSRRKSTSNQTIESSDAADLTTDVYSGILIDHGVEHRELEGREFNQYQCRIKNDSRNGNITQVWGEDIQRAIKDSGVRKGNHVRIEEIRVKGERKKSFSINKI